MSSIYTVWVPSAVVLVAVFFVNKALLPVALLLPVLLFSVQFLLLDKLERQGLPTGPRSAASTTNGTQVSNGKEEDEDEDPNIALRPSKFKDFALIKKTIVSHNVTIYRFALDHPDQILGLPIGQHMSLTASIPDAEGTPKDVMRSYTPISSDEDKGCFDLLIKAYPQGNISKYMTTLKIGETMKVRGPKGAMVYTPGLVKRFGMIAGGTGITPMLQIIRAIVRGRPRNGGKDTTEVDLIFANVNEDDILLREELDALVKEDGGSFRVYHVLNNPPQKWDGGVGFVTADIIKERLPPPSADMKLLLCGPPPMVKAMKGAAESLGYDKAKPVSKLADQVFCF